VEKANNMHEKRFSGDIARLRSGERVERLEVRLVIQLSLEGGSFRHMLDVGTGSGLFAEGFSRHNLDVTGVDANHEMLPVAKSYVPQGRFLQATAEELPFASRSFDLVFFGLVLHEADDALKVLQAAHRVSRKRICLLEWPYREQTFGPPLTDRLSPARMEEIFHRAGFARWECVHLANTILYMLDSDLI
jgi:ubiquinone/menaquinone biosynthesis C-methylase UbiE